MELVRLLVVCSVVTFASTTYVHQRPIAYSKLDPNSEDPKLADRHEQGSSVKKETNREPAAGPAVFLPGLPLYSPVYLNPVRGESGGHGHGHNQNTGNGGAFGASGSLVIPGLNLNLGAGNIFGGSLSASGGFSGFYGPNHGHGHGAGGGHAGAYAGSLITPVHYGYPLYHGYPHHHTGGAGGLALAGAHQGFVPFYAGSHGTYHKASESPASASGVVNTAPSGPVLQGVTTQGESLQEKQPDVLLEVSPFQQEGEHLDQPGLPAGFHHPGFIVQSAGRLGYPVFMPSSEQLQDLSFRQTPNPFVQFFQRPIQALQMFIRPMQNNSTKQPEKLVSENPSVGRPGLEKPVDAKPNSEKPSVQSQAADSPVKNQGKQNTTAPASNQKKPLSSLANVSVSSDKKDKKEKPKPSASSPPAVSDVVASVNEVVKATAVVNAGSAPVLPVFIEEADAKSRVGDDVKTALEESIDANVNVVPNDESAVDLESKPVA